MKQEILSALDNCPLQGSFHYYEVLDSTNREAKQLVKDGAPHGTIVVAASQTAGRGRLGRTFCSPGGNMYFSMILRPDCPPTDLMHLTCWAAVAACDAVESVTGMRPRVKWINDLVYKGKKLGGILTELVLGQETVEAAIIGIGINCLCLPPEVADMATTLTDMANRPISPAPVIAALAKALSTTDYHQMPERYRQDCLTIGAPVKRMDTGSVGTALDVTDEGALVIAMEDGSVQTVASGEVSVRGLYGYV